MRLGRLYAVLLLYMLFVAPMSSLAKETRDVIRPSPNDFAYGIPLEVVEDGALYEAALPPEFYRGILRNDLSDACVFNGQGEVVPFALQKITTEAASPPPTVTLPIFPIYGTPGEKPEGLSLHLHRDSSGAIIDMDANTNDAQAQERKVVAYLLDAGSLHHSFNALVLDWPTSPEGFVAKISVEYSEDLDHWSTLLTGTTIASLRYEDHSLEQRKVDLNRPLKAKYLRLSWTRTQEEVRLTAAAAQLAQDMPEPERQWATAGVTAKSDRSGEYNFEAPGAMPVDRIRLKFPQKNTLVQASFFSRAAEKDTWKPRNAGRDSLLAYSLRVEGEDFVNPDIPMIPGTARQWLMRIEPAGGFGRGVPQIELGWTPQKLVFVARGDGPFQLAYGSARSTGRGFQVDDLLTKFAERHKNKLFVKAARAGPRMMLGGEAMLKPPIPPYPWKEWALWLVLVLGVILLAWMTLRLYRQMNHPNDRSTDNKS